MPAVNLCPTFGAGFQSFLPNGLPNTQGYIYTYAAGTSTPLGAYTESTGTTLAANPIPLNSDGTLPYTLWMTNGLAYKIVITDSLLVPLASRTFDNIGGMVLSYGALAVTNITASGNITCLTLTASGAIAAASYGAINGTTAALSGALTGTSGAFSAGLTCVGISSTTGTFSGALSATTGTFSGDVTFVTAAGTKSSGYRDIPSNPKTIAYILAATDVGQSIDTIAGVTVPWNTSVALPIGFTAMITNTSAAAITITQDSFVSVFIGGTATTGNRTLAQKGVATVRKYAADAWIITGAGVT